MIPQSKYTAVLQPIGRKRRRRLFSRLSLIQTVFRETDILYLLPQTVIKSEWREISGREQLRGAEQLGPLPEHTRHRGRTAAILASSLLRRRAGPGPRGDGGTRPSSVIKATLS